MPSARDGAAKTVPNSSASSSANRLRLPQESIEEAVMPFVRKQLASGQFCLIVGRGEGQARRVPMALQESLDLIAIFLSKHGAGRVQQFTTTGEQLPQRGEQLVLLACELLQVGGAPQPFHVGPSPRDAGRAARGVEQDALER